jgi:dienelactone hydrolase
LEGGLSESEAALLASHGYVTFALAYFRAEGLPQQLVNIPLEYLKKGLDWLAARDTVDAQRLAVVGGSKGAELALLLAAHHPEVRAVVARAPSHVVWFGIGGTYRDPSWTLQGKPVPYVLPSPTLFPKVFSKRPLRLVDLYGPALDDEKSVKASRIPVEKINGAVLLLSGTDDAMWPASRMADQMVTQLRDQGHRFPVVHLKYDGAGHSIPNAYVPTRATIEASGMLLGGTAQANAKALADARPKVLQFLKDHLEKRGR